MFLGEERSSNLLWCSHCRDPKENAWYPRLQVSHFNSIWSRQQWGGCYFCILVVLTISCVIYNFSMFFFYILGKSSFEETLSQTKILDIHDNISFWCSSWVSRFPTVCSYLDTARIKQQLTFWLFGWFSAQFLKLEYVFSLPF